MSEVLEKIMPNVMADPERFWDSVTATLQMTAWSGCIMFVLGLLFGVILTVTRDGGIMQQRAVHQILDKLVNLFRSIPFVIFIAILLPVTKAIMGTENRRSGSYRAFGRGVGLLFCKTGRNGSCRG